MIILFLLKIFSETKILYGNELLERFTSYCTPKYKFVDSKGTLKNVIAIFRHGDRAPLIMNEFWKKQSCMQCINSECFMTSCSDGLLTTKGFEQGKELGRFIKENYIKRMNDVNSNDVNSNSNDVNSNTNDVNSNSNSNSNDNSNSNNIITISTGVNRTLSMLGAVSKGMKIELEKIKIKNEFTGISKCSKKMNIFQNEKNPKKLHNITDYSKFDNLITAVCTPINVKCDDLDCDFTKIDDFLSQITLKYEDGMIKSRENVFLNELAFSKVSKEISKLLDLENKITLISAHDSTLSIILNGLNISMNSIPSYGSAIFIEIWEDNINDNKGDTKGNDNINNNTNKKFVRINYQGQIMEFGFFKEKIIAFEEFKKHLNLFSSKSDQIENMCENNSEKSLEDLFNPLTKLIHDQQIASFSKEGNGIIRNLKEYIKKISDSNTNDQNDIKIDNNINHMQNNIASFLSDQIQSENKKSLLSVDKVRNFLSIDKLRNFLSVDKASYFFGWFKNNLNSDKNDLTKNVKKSKVKNDTNDATKNDNQNDTKNDTKNDSKNDKKADKKKIIKCDELELSDDKEIDSIPEACDQFEDDNACDKNPCDNEKNPCQKKPAKCRKKVQKKEKPCNDGCNKTSPTCQGNPNSAFKKPNSVIVFKETPSSCSPAGDPAAPTPCGEKTLFKPALSCDKCNDDKKCDGNPSIDTPCALKALKPSPPTVTIHAKPCAVSNPLIVRPSVANPPMAPLNFSKPTETCNQGVIQPFLPGNQMAVGSSPAPNIMISSQGTYNPFALANS